MSPTKTKLRLAGAFGVFAMLAIALSCTGFFVKPTLSSISVGPGTPTIETGTSGNTVQMTASGTFNDGSTGNPPVTWSTNPTGIATISASGLVTSVAEGTTTITASSTQNSAISGSTTLTVTVGCIISIAVTPTSPSILVGQTQPFVATANTCQGSFDLTNVASWQSSNTATATIDATGTASALAVGTTQITATSGNIVSPAVTLTVN